MAAVIKANLQYRNTLTPLNLSRVKYIVLHHAEAVTATPEQIHQWHLQNGWSGAGYNEYIRKDGTAYIMRGDNVGAHCTNYNSTGYGICCEGNYDAETTMPAAQKQALIERIKHNEARLANYEATLPHSRLYNTSCPGRYFPLAEILSRLEVANMNIEEAKQILIENGVINSPEYWNKTIDTVKNQEQLFINMAKKIKELKI